MQVAFSFEGTFFCPKMKSMSIICGLSFGNEGLKWFIRVDGHLAEVEQRLPDVLVQAEWDQVIWLNFAEPSNPQICIAG